MTPQELFAEALMAEGDVEEAFAGLVVRPPWMADALCRERPEVEFFVDVGEDVEPAKAVCAGCLVKVECLAFALNTGVDHGVWGGTSPRARAALRKARRAA